MHLLCAMTLLLMMRLARNNDVIKQSLWGFVPSIGTAQKKEHLGLSGFEATMYLRRGSLCWNLKDE